MSLPQIPTIPTVSPGQPWTSAMFNGVIGQGLLLLLNPPLALLGQTASQSISNNLVTTINWDNESYDSYGGHSNTVNNTRYVVQIPGFYDVLVSLDWATNATGTREASIIKNGVGIPGAFASANAASLSHGLQVSITVQCAVGDYIEATGYQNSGSGLTVGTGQSVMQVRFVHA